MPLSPEQRAALTKLAAERGVDSAEVIREAESIAGGAAPEAAAAPPAASAKHPGADRFLIGFLPFITVAEFRSIWLGLDAPVPDGELMTGEWLMRHGQTAPASDAGESGGKGDDGPNGRSGDADPDGREET